VDLCKSLSQYLLLFRFLCSILSFLIWLDVLFCILSVYLGCIHCAHLLNLLIKKNISIYVYIHGLTYMLMNVNMLTMLPHLCVYMLVAE
jgi:hypothetical protein